MEKISTEKLYSLCNRYQWFTSGSIKQYKKMFECAEQGASIEKIATIIWICSIDYEEQEILKILQKERDR